MRPVETVKPYGRRLHLVVAAICLPYVVGFALSRHGSILYLPAIIYIIRSVHAG